MKRNKFSLSHYKLATLNQGELVPIGLTEVLPGDSIQHATTALVRLSPLLAPVMHPCHIRIQHYFVPNRLVWDDWEDFITGGEDGLDASSFPTITFGGGTGASLGSLADYMGVPTGVDGIEVSALPFRGYALIWNERIRNTDLQTELVIDKTDGADTTTSTVLKNDNWEKDYFTSAHSDTQLGDEVTVPLGEQAFIKVSDHTTNPTGGDDDYYVARSNGASYHQHYYDSSLDSAGTLFPDPSRANLYADLENASGATINQLREAFALQKYAEARQRYGSRYTEYLRYLGVKSADSRLQRPEYLAGGKQTVQFSEVLQTGVDSSDEGVGTMTGHGVGAIRSNRYRRFFEEHGYIHSFISVRPKTIYTQGLARTWNRRSKEDFFQRELQHIGMQEILNKEVYAGHTTPEGTFAYQDRYDDYRRTFSSISGEFRNGGGLEHWHMSRIFTGDPALNDTFLTANPTDRIYASTATDQLLVMANHSIQARRILSRRGTPGGI